MYITIYATWKDTKEDFTAKAKIGNPTDADIDAGVKYFFEDENELGEDIFKFIINGYEDESC